MVSREIKKLDLSDEGNDLAFWMAQTPAERLTALGVLRDRYARLKRMDIQPDFKDFIALLNQYHVSYLVVGGFAVAQHGYPRFTADIDFWVKPQRRKRGEGSERLERLWFCRPGYIGRRLLKAEARRPTRISSE